MSVISLCLAGSGMLPAMAGIDNVTSLGSLIREGCEEQGISKRALALKLKVHHSVVQDYISGAMRVSERLAPKMARILCPDPDAYRNFMRCWERQDNQHLREMKKRVIRREAMKRAARKYVAIVENQPITKESVEHNIDRWHLDELIWFVEVFHNSDIGEEYPILTIYSFGNFSCECGKEMKYVDDASFEEQLWIYRDYCKRKHIHPLGLIELARAEVLASPVLNPETYQRSSFTLIPTHVLELWKQQIRAAADALDKNESERTKNDRWALSNLGRLPDYGMAAFNLEAQEAGRARTRLLSAIDRVSSSL